MLVMLKFRRIEISLDPKYSSADEILGQIRRFYCISRSIILFLFLIIIVAVITLISYIFLEKSIIRHYVVWIPISTSCSLFLFSFFLAIYFTRMGLRLLTIVKRDGHDINVKKLILVFILLDTVSFIGHLQLSAVQVYNQLRIDEIKCDGPYL